MERNPTDLQLRFELGEHLVNAQRFREAVPELQRARQNPNARLKAMNLLGLCYRELGMLDLAMKQFEDAAKEILTMDAMKKEIVYNLGIVYEKMGEQEKSLNCMKQIYESGLRLQRRRRASGKLVSAGIIGRSRTVPPGRSRFRSLHPTVREHANL